MKKVILLFSILVFFLGSSDLFAVTGWFQDYVKLNINSGGEAWY